VRDGRLAAYPLAPVNRPVGGVTVEGARNAIAAFATAAAALNTTSLKWLRASRVFWIDDAGRHIGGHAYHYFETLPLEAPPTHV